MDDESRGLVMAALNVTPGRKLVCTICGADAKLADDGHYRHANEPFRDASRFCVRYGYPIRVRAVDE